MTRTVLALKDRVRVGRSNVGRGVFAKTKLRRGQKIGEFLGRVFEEADYKSEYCIDLGGDWQMEPGPPLRFINHRCDPNCEILYTDEGRGASRRRRLWLYATRTIQPGEELNIDYGWPAEMAIPCQCGSGSCRGWVVAAAELKKVKKPQSAASKR